METYVRDKTKAFYEYDDKYYRVHIYSNGGTISFKKDRIEDLYKILCWYQKAPRDIRDMFMSDSKSFKLGDFLNSSCFGIYLGLEIDSNYIFTRHIDMIKRCLEKVIDKPQSLDIEFKVEELENIDTLALKFLTLCIEKKKFKINNGNIILRL